MGKESNVGGGGVGAGEYRWLRQKIEKREWAEIIEERMLC